MIRLPALALETLRPHPLEQGSHHACYSNAADICQAQSTPRTDAAAVSVLQGGAVSSAAIAFVMAAAMAGAGPAGRILRLLLGGPSWKPLADFSYSAYLYHEHVSS